MAWSKNGTTQQGGATSVFSTSWTSANITVGSNTNGILIVSVATYLTTPPDPLVTGVKWGGSGGAALTKVVSHCESGSSQEISLWYLVAPTAQTSTLYFTFGASFRDVCFSATVCDGITQTSPASGGVEGLTGWGTDHSINVASATGSVVFDAVCYTAAGSATCGQTQDGNLVAYGNLIMYQSHKTGSTTTTMQWTSSANSSELYAAASFAPYVDASHINIALAVGGS
jgi:hypothetical protein